MTDLEQRYRRPGRASQAVALVVVAALVLSGVGFLGWTLVFASRAPEVRSQLSAYEIVDDHTAVGTINVVRKTQFVEATCQVVAVAEDFAVVGEVRVTITDGPAEATYDVEVRTERRATTVDLLGCTTPDQPRPR